MNKLRQTLFKTLALLLCFIAIGAYGQKQTKTFNETFNVSEEALLDIDTSHADIEFETWNKNTIAIEAIIEIEGATDEEAEQYFKNSGFEILGNSKKVSIKAGRENIGLWSHGLSDAQNFHIEIPEFPELHGYAFDFDFEEILDMPSFPINPKVEFDHKAFKKDGDKYLKKWKKEFYESYDEEHVKKLEEWAKHMEKRQEKMQDKMEEMHEKREKARVKRVEKMQEARAKRDEARVKRREKILQLRTIEDDTNNIFFFNSNGENEPNIFYFPSGGKNKNYKVKKTIKVKMPKGMKIKMNVRHGEVKLAENTKNINATLSHSSLWATTIDGEKTMISASYSPIHIQNWNYGQLQTKYSDNVALKEVLNLRLNATSSDVTIEHLINSAFINNDFGPLKIKSVSKDFSDLDITLHNAELNCKTPNVPFTIYVNGTSSKLIKPTSGITLHQTKNHNNTIHKGYFKNKNAGKSIVINSKYSEVVLE